MQPAATTLEQTSDTNVQNVNNNVNTNRNSNSTSGSIISQQTQRKQKDKFISTLVDDDDGDGYDGNRINHNTNNDSSNPHSTSSSSSSCFSYCCCDSSNSSSHKNASSSSRISFRTVVTLIFISFYILACALPLYFVFSGALDTIFPSIEFLLNQTTLMVNSELTSVFATYRMQSESVKNWTRRFGLPLANEINRYQYTSLTLGQFLLNPMTAAHFRQFADGSMQAAAINKRYVYVITDTEPKAIWDWTAGVAANQPVAVWKNATVYFVDPFVNFTGFVGLENVSLPLLTPPRAFVNGPLWNSSRQLVARFPTLVDDLLIGSYSYDPTRAYSLIIQVLAFGSRNSTDYASQPLYVSNEGSPTFVYSEVLTRILGEMNVAGSEAFLLDPSQNVIASSIWKNDSNAYTVESVVTTDPRYGVTCFVDPSNAAMACLKSIAVDPELRLLKLVGANTPGFGAAATRGVAGLALQVTDPDSGVNFYWSYSVNSMSQTIKMRVYLFIPQDVFIAGMRREMIVAFVVAFVVMLVGATFFFISMRFISSKIEILAEKMYKDPFAATDDFALTNSSSRNNSTTGSPTSSGFSSGIQSPKEAELDSEEIGGDNNNMSHDDNDTKNNNGNSNKIKVGRRNSVELLVDGKVNRKGNEQPQDERKKKHKSRSWRIFWTSLSSFFSFPVEEISMLHQSFLEFRAVIEQLRCFMPRQDLLSLMEIGGGGRNFSDSASFRSGATSMTNLPHDSSGEITASTDTSLIRRRSTTMTATSAAHPRHEDDDEDWITKQEQHQQDQKYYYYVHTSPSSKSSEEKNDTVEGTSLNGDSKNKNDTNDNASKPTSTSTSHVVVPPTAIPVVDAPDTDMLPHATSVAQDNNNHHNNNINNVQSHNNSNNNETHNISDEINNNSSTKKQKIQSSRLPASILKNSASNNINNNNNSDGGSLSSLGTTNNNNNNLTANIAVFTAQNASNIGNIKSPPPKLEETTVRHNQNNNNCSKNNSSPKYNHNNSSDCYDTNNNKSSSLVEQQHQLENESVKNNDSNNNNNNNSTNNTTLKKTQKVVQFNIVGDDPSNDADYYDELDEEEYEEEQDEEEEDEDDDDENSKTFKLTRRKNREHKNLPKDYFHEDFKSDEDDDDDQTVHVANGQPKVEIVVAVNSTAKITEKTETEDSSASEELEPPDFKIQQVQQSGKSIASPRTTTKNKSRKRSGQGNEVEKFHDGNDDDDDEDIHVIESAGDDHDPVRSGSLGHAENLLLAQKKNKNSNDFDSDCNAAQNTGNGDHGSGGLAVSKNKFRRVVKNSPTNNNNENKFPTSPAKMSQNRSSSPSNSNRNSRRKNFARSVAVAAAKAKRRAREEAKSRGVFFTASVSVIFVGDGEQDEKLLLMRPTAMKRKNSCDDDDEENEADPPNKINIIGSYLDDNEVENNNGDHTKTGSDAESGNAVDPTHDPLSKTKRKKQIMDWTSYVAEIIDEKLLKPTGAHLIEYRNNTFLIALRLSSRSREKVNFFQNSRQNRPPPAVRSRLACRFVTKLIDISDDLSKKRNEILGLSSTLSSEMEGENVVVGNDNENATAARLREEISKNLERNRVVLTAGFSAGDCRLIRMQHKNNNAGSNNLNDSSQSNFSHNGSERSSRRSRNKNSNSNSNRNHVISNSNVNNTLDFTQSSSSSNNNNGNFNSKNGPSFMMTGTYGAVNFVTSTTANNNNNRTSSNTHQEALNNSNTNSSVNKSQQPLRPVTILGKAVTEAIQAHNAMKQEIDKVESKLMQTLSKTTISENFKFSSSHSNKITRKIGTIKNNNNTTAREGKIREQKIDDKVQNQNDPGDQEQESFLEGALGTTESTTQEAATRNPAVEDRQGVFVSNSVENVNNNNNANNFLHNAPSNQLLQQPVLTLQTFHLKHALAFVSQEVFPILQMPSYVLNHKTFERNFAYFYSNNPNKRKSNQLAMDDDGENSSNNITPSTIARQRLFNNNADESIEAFVRGGGKNNNQNSKNNTKNYNHIPMNDGDESENEGSFGKDEPVLTLATESLQEKRSLLAALSRRNKNSNNSQQQLRRTILQRFSRILGSDFVEVENSTIQQNVVKNPKNKKNRKSNYNRASPSSPTPGYTRQYHYQQTGEGSDAEDDDDNNNGGIDYVTEDHHDQKLVSPFVAIPAGILPNEREAVIFFQGNYIPHLLKIQKKLAFMALKGGKNGAAHRVATKK